MTGWINQHIQFITELVESIEDTKSSPLANLGNIFIPRKHWRDKHLSVSFFFISFLCKNKNPIVQKISLVRSSNWRPSKVYNKFSGVGSVSFSNQIWNMFLAWSSASAFSLSKYSIYKKKKQQWSQREKERSHLDAIGHSKSSVENPSVD